MRIGRQISHSQNVNLATIVARFDEQKKFRYLLQYDFLGDKNRQKVITVIMKNPSSADERAADATNRRVQDYIFHNFTDVKTVKILNVFSLRATDAHELNIVKDHIDLVNDFYILRAIEHTDYIIVAWGGASGIKKKLYDSRVNIVQKILKYATAPIYRINPEKGSWQYPFHFCFASLKHELEELQGT